MREEQTYKVSRRAQLIDLNKDHTNFTLRFECHGDPNIPFQLCITNQSELDTKDMSELQMKTVEGGSISGTIVADSNVYQNYFAVLRSEQDMDVTVVVDIEPLEVNSPSPSHGQDDVSQGQSSSPATPYHSHGENSGSWMKILFVVLLILFFLVIVYYIFQLSEDIPSSSMASSTEMGVSNAGLGNNPPTSHPNYANTTISPPISSAPPSVVDEIMNSL